MRRWPWSWSVPYLDITQKEMLVAASSHPVTAQVLSLATPERICHSLWKCREKLQRCGTLSTLDPKVNDRFHGIDAAHRPWIGNTSNLRCFSKFNYTSYKLVIVIPPRALVSPSSTPLSGSAKQNTKERGATLVAPVYQLK